MKPSAQGTLRPPLPKRFYLISEVGGGACDFFEIEKPLKITLRRIFNLRKHTHIKDLGRLPLRIAGWIFKLDFFLNLGPFLENHVETPWATKIQ